MPVHRGREAYAPFEADGAVANPLGICDPDMAVSAGIREMSD
jgi:hypothetical protein